MKTLIITALLLTSIYSQAQEKLYFNQITTKDVNLKNDKVKNIEMYDVNNSYFLWGSNDIEMYVQGEILSKYKIIESEEVEKGMFKLLLKTSSKDNVILYWSHDKPTVVLFYPKKRNKVMMVEINMEGNLVSHQYKKESTTYINL